MYVASARYLLGTPAAAERPVAACARRVIAVVVSVGLYLVFEWSFQVALPHGLLGAWLER